MQNALAWPVPVHNYPIGWDVFQMNSWNDVIGYAIDTGTNCSKCLW